MQMAIDTSPSGRCYQHLAELHTSHHPDALDVLKLGQLVQPLSAGTRLGGVGCSPRRFSAQQRPLLPGGG